MITTNDISSIPIDLLLIRKPVKDPGKKSAGETKSPPETVQPLKIYRRPGVNKNKRIKHDERKGEHDQKIIKVQFLKEFFHPESKIDNSI